uniref:Uncharacterized protein n=1 Tax=Anopheles christyi TaxID=43041 RepID=A0A182KIM8_9DIPT
MVLQIQLVLEPPATNATLKWHIVRVCRLVVGQIVRSPKRTAADGAWVALFSCDLLLVLQQKKYRCKALPADITLERFPIVRPGAGRSIGRFVHTLGVCLQGSRIFKHLPATATAASPLFLYLLLVGPLVVQL